MPSVPKVSVCVITFNHGEWLRECLESIVHQKTDFDYEVIVGDDCSTDGLTPKILKEFTQKYPSKIIPLHRDVNMGGGGTQNWLNVMINARGEYLANIDGDDRMLPGKLQKQVDFLELHPECAVVAHGLRTFDSNTGATLPNGFGGKYHPEIADINYLLLHHCYFGHSSKMFRRSAMITLQRNKPTVDFFMHIEHATRGAIGYIAEVLGEYRKSTGTASAAGNSSSNGIVEGYYDAFNRALELGVDPAVVARGRLLFNYSIAYRCLQSPDQSEFCKFIHLEEDNFENSSWKHRLFFKLRFFPLFLLLIIKIKEYIASLVNWKNKQI